MALGGCGTSHFNSKAGFQADSRWPHPFCDAASMAMPDTIYEAMYYCHMIASRNGIYREAIKRVLSYFVTDVQISGNTDEEEAGREEQEKYKSFLDETLGLKAVLNLIGLDYLVAGISFTSLQFPFRRYLSCPTQGCGHEAPLSRVYNNDAYKFAWLNMEFHATCPLCHQRGRWRHIDRRSGDQSQIRIKRWSPFDMELAEDPYSGKVTYIWRIPAEDRAQIREGRLIHLEDIPWEVVEAVRRNENLQFDRDAIYCMKQEAPAGMKMRGWGYSGVLVNFALAWYHQTLMRYNEAIVLDHVVPFRVVTPEARAGADGFGNDPINSLGMAGFVSRVQRMFKAHRQDPNQWNVMPFALKYTALGGDATTLAPKDLIDQSLDMLLSAIGVPMELFKGTLNVQGAPAALRLFEASWAHLPHALNRFLANLVEKIGAALSWDPVSARLERPTHADDLNRQMAKLQLMQQRNISQTTGLASVGLDYRREIRQILDEERLQAEEQQRMQKEMEQAAMMDELATPMQGGVGQPGASAGQGQPAPAPAQPTTGAVPPGAMYPQPSAVDQFIAARQNTPHVQISLEDLEAQAEIIANELMAKPESEKDSKLIKLKKVHPAMHALVSSRLRDMRRALQTQGGAMLQAQMQQGQMQGKAARARRYIEPPSDTLDPDIEAAAAQLLRRPRFLSV